MDLSDFLIWGAIKIEIFGEWSQFFSFFNQKSCVFNMDFMIFLINY